MSSPLIEILGQALGGNTIGRIGDQIGADRRSTQSAINMAIPVLISALTRNASTPGGYQSLENAVNRDHDGSILDDLGGLLGGAGGAGGADLGGVGGKILGHVLGGQQQSVQDGIGRASGLDPAAVGGLLSILAPIVMGALGRANQQTPASVSVSDILNGAHSRLGQSAPRGGDILSQILDRNHDGSAFDDVARMGASVLGGLLRGGR